MRLFDVVLDPARLRRTVAVAAAILVSAPLGASASSHHGSDSSRTAAAGVSYGGITSQDFPLVVETNRQRRQVVRAIIAIRLTCATGGFMTVPDGYVRLAMSKKGKFSASFGPQTMRNDDGTTLDFQGRISGAFNTSRTRVSGVWSYTATIHDTAGAVTDTCDSGNVTWSAKQ
jgi:hypothetical protein